MFIISIDPGKHNVAVAGFFERELVFARYFVTKEVHVKDSALHLSEQVNSFVRGQAVLLDSSPAVVVGELPQVYQGAKQEGDPAHLIELAYVLGAVVHMNARAKPAEVALYRPSEWKGQTPKPKKATDPYIIENKVLALLSDNEREIYKKDLPARSYQHNVADSVGLGLHHLRRLTIR